MFARSLIIRSLYAACLAGATMNHVRSILAQGWLPEHLPWPTAAYWSSLTLLDPLAAFLLFLRPRIGIAGTMAIIASNVVHNLWFVSAHRDTRGFLDAVVNDPFLLSQIAFLVFVGLTARLASPVADRPRAAAHDDRP
ncbi:hypothetical protein [Allosphingosinicella deserti]|uniref:DoxX family protein n=1 Tax=Allosphingosinicella deserti TaxID=2116704 RepID=A0A2P7QND8_9SPHN|nr:hypothetical protein [Sphingomonas deserti]PSJ39466.1 hypothetical protein C7I55_12710 [Sphingomonas deserti]